MRLRRCVTLAVLLIVALSTQDASAFEFGTPATLRPCRITIPTTRCGAAPSATRMPISRVRRATEYAMTP